MCLKWLKKQRWTGEQCLLSTTQHLLSCSEPAWSWYLCCELHITLRENNLQMMKSLNHSSPWSRGRCWTGMECRNPHPAGLWWEGHSPTRVCCSPLFQFKSNSCCCHRHTGGKPEGAGSSGEALLNSKRAGKVFEQDQSPQSPVPHPPNPALRQHPQHVHQQYI